MTANAATWYRHLAACFRRDARVAVRIAGPTPAQLARFQADMLHWADLADKAAAKADREDTK